MAEKSQDEAACKREIRIKRLHFGNNKGIMSEEIGSDESYDPKADTESRWQV